MGEENKKSKIWIWLLFVLLFLAIIGGIYYFFTKNQVNKTSTGESASSEIAMKNALEKWTRDDKMIMANTTSTDTHKITDDLYRMYRMGQGGIYYSESTDGISFDGGKSTGVTEDKGKMISNPTVLKIYDGKWIMIYEQAPIRQPGEKLGSPGVSNQRNLYLATSTDGEAFIEAGVAVDSSKADNYFASVPELVLMPSNVVVMYYVSGGESIARAYSIDEGRSWTRNNDYVLENAVDPDIIVELDISAVKNNQVGGKMKFTMYYSMLDPAKNAIYKATSIDGEEWNLAGKVLEKKNSNSAIVDPDVVEISTGKYMMFFGESESETSTGGSAINLYRATTDESIF
ncbi:MAG: hypothetical protein Athens101428_391 [Candidatus Berkelbacteria bacterium Athens1014_28]|uniref:Exo-alpha-sialidase n=1 Tax=Candidatus Berkelbacteria bacterium Athens1014_28 TaxID=2017145 RepID=A0A554LN21_9BACT|nr:MAG: hypothetical protein Athens101428_391 [Candidatus Berkelbacteria bacterium Athens1014_28]